MINPSAPPIPFTALPEPIELMRSLHIDRNNLTGEIPIELGNLLNLEGLLLYDNQLTGEIPSWIGTLINLKDIVLDQIYQKNKYQQ